MSQIGVCMYVIYLKKHGLLKISCNKSCYKLCFITLFVCLMLFGHTQEFCTPAEMSPLPMHDLK